MSRNLKQLQERYSSSTHSASPQNSRGRGMGRGKQQMMKSEKPKSTKSVILRLLSYFNGYYFRIVLILVCMLFSTLTALIGSYLLAPIIDKLAFAVKSNPESELTRIEKIADQFIAKFSQQFTENEVMNYVITASIILAIIYLIGVCTTYLQSKLMLNLSQTVIEKLRNQLFEKIQSLPLRFFDSRPTGEIMSRFTNDIDTIDVMINNSLTSIISGMVTLVGTFVFMVTTSWLLTLVTIIFIPIVAKSSMLIAKKSQKYYSMQQTALGAINGYMEETVTGQKVVKVFNHEETCIEEFHLLNQDMREKQFYAQFLGSIMGPIMGNLSQIAYGITVGIGAVLMVCSKLTPGGLTVFATYSRQFSQPINQISQQMSTIFSALAGAERVFEVLDMELETDFSGEDEALSGNIVLDHVSFGYQPERRILKNISLSVKEGDKIAFVGSTGAGKTTITNLMNRFYDIDEGEILFGDKKIRDIPRSVLRKNVGYVLQDTHLFTDTVMENIRYGRMDATDEEVIEAAKVASAHSFIMRLSDGYQTMLTGDGSNLSQGQRQLLNIARAALSKAPILILDEATSSVDTRTEKHIEHGMDRLMQNRTTFVIAHRLSTVRNSDMIYILEAGEIIESGTHEALLAQKGKYYELYTGSVELD